MTKTEVEAAICALPGVVSYRETQNDLQRTIRFEITFREGDPIKESMPYKDLNSWQRLRRFALDRATEVVHGAPPRSARDLPVEDFINAGVIPVSKPRPAEYPNGYVGAEYVCHKRVRAAKIVSWQAYDAPRIDLKAEVPPDDMKILLHFDEGLPDVIVRLGEVRGLEAGGYLVQYVDGYRSYSPAKAFEEGYSRIAESVPPSEGT